MIHHMLSNIVNQNTLNDTVVHTSMDHNYSGCVCFTGLYLILYLFTCPGCQDLNFQCKNLSFLARQPHIHLSSLVVHIHPSVFTLMHLLSGDQSSSSHSSAG